MPARRARRYGSRAVRRRRGARAGSHRRGQRTSPPIVLEPVVERLPSREWLQRARELCDSSGAVLVFDEIKTGFRVAPGGYQELVGVTPDLATFGKAMANGFPLSAVVGRAAVMDAARRTWISSTLASESTALAAALAVLDWHEEADICATLADTGREMRASLDRAIAASGRRRASSPMAVDPMMLLRWDDPGARGALPRRRARAPASCSSAAPTTSPPSRTTTTRSARSSRRRAQRSSRWRRANGRRVERLERGDHTAHRRTRALLPRRLGPRGLGASQRRTHARRRLRSVSRTTSSACSAPTATRRRPISPRRPTCHAATTSMRELADADPERVRWYVTVNPNHTAHAVREIGAGRRRGRDRE